MKVLENDELLKFTFFLIIYLVNILLKKVYLLIASLSFRQNQEPHILNKSIFEGAYQLLLKIWYLIFLFLVFLISGIRREETNEQRLVKDLLNGYDKRVRPVMPSNTSLPLNVTFGLALSQIIDVVSIDSKNLTS